MTSLTSLARAEAALSGTAQRIRTVRHLHVAHRPLVIVPLALAGEANAPLAVMIGDDPDHPTVLINDRPQDRQQRQVFAAAIAGVFTRYLSGFTQATENFTVGRHSHKETRVRTVDAPQLWVASPAGADYLRLLGRATRFRRTTGDYAVAPSVPLMGKWLTWFADQFEFADSNLLVATTRALADMWATGQSAVEDGNLAALMAWVDPPAGFTSAQAALRAEDPLLWPPAGPATDPLFDREILEPSLKAIAKARDNVDALDRLHQQYEEDLDGQMRPTWNQIWQSIRLLGAIPQGDHVAQRWDRDRTEFAGYLSYLNGDGWPQAKRDNAVRSAKRLHDRERRQVQYETERALDDVLVMAEHRLRGEAFTGIVVAADLTQTLPGSRRPAPHIAVATADPVRMLPGDSNLRDQQRRNQEASILDIQPDGERLLIRLQLQKGMGNFGTPPPGSVPAAGDQVTYSHLGNGYFRPVEFPAPADTPWTHGGPPQPYIPTDDDAREDWS